MRVGSLLGCVMCGTYVVGPLEFVEGGVGPDVTLEVEIVAFLDVVAVDVAAQGDAHLGRIWKRKKTVRHRLPSDKIKKIIFRVTLDVEFDGLFHHRPGDHRVLDAADEVAAVVVRFGRQNQSGDGHVAVVGILRRGAIKN